MSVSSNVLCSGSLFRVAGLNAYETFQTTGLGKDAITTQCVLDITQSLTQLGLMGIAIDALANADCSNPSVGRVTTKALPKFVRKRLENIRRASCGAGITQVIAQLGLVTVFLSFTSFHCTNVANIGAICGAGVAGATGALSGIAAAGMGAYIACKEGQRTNATAALVEKFAADFVAQEAEDIVQASCPYLSLDCFLEFTTFFSNCPPGATTPGPVDASCPVVPSPKKCPGIQRCAKEFEELRPNLTTWFPFPSDPVEFNEVVENANSCFAYLTCFLKSSPPPGRRLESDTRRIESDARRSLLLQKILGPHPEQWRLLIHGGPGVHRGRLPAEGLEWSERLWNATVVDTAESSVSSDSILHTTLRGSEFLEEAAQNLHKLEANSAVCPANDGPLLDESSETIP
ncbi:Klc [Symbiodinium pilosum]|uniref:Klc protein n=1 Tax=Symbiodinium pilosum TaxID=2952 RepID=A0A812VX85_SYMPI|nr:Klc [Symbiodinium pilosum]